MSGVVLYLKRLGVQNVGRFVSRLPPVLGYDVNTNLAPKVREAGVKVFYPWTWSIRVRCFRGPRRRLRKGSVFLVFFCFCFLFCFFRYVFCFCFCFFRYVGWCPWAVDKKKKKRRKKKSMYVSWSVYVVCFFFRISLFVCDGARWTTWWRRCVWACTTCSPSRRTSRTRWTPSSNPAPSSSSSGNYIRKLCCECAPGIC